VNEPESVPEAIDRYLREGTYVSDHPAWPGKNFMEKARNGRDDLLRALVVEVKRRAVGKTHAPLPPGFDVIPWTRSKLTPMVHGLFHAAEREPVLSLLERSVVFLTADNIEQVLLGQRWLHTAWSLANLFLSSVEADLLGPEAPSLLGLTERYAHLSPDVRKDAVRLLDRSVPQVHVHTASMSADAAGK
jgi:hypothetical protein